MFAGRYFGARHFGARYFGKLGLVVDSAHFGSRFFGPRYFGSRYFSSNGRSEDFAITETAGVSLAGSALVSASGISFGADFAITETAGLSLAGSASLTTAISFENEVFYITPPLPLGGLSGTVTLAAGIVITAPVPGFGSYFGRRHFGRRYFGPRYFGSPAGFGIQVTSGLGLTGTLTAAGGIATAIGIAPSTLGLTGTALVTADVSAGDPKPATSVGGFVANRSRGRNYIVKGRRYYDITEEELKAVLATEFERVKRSQIKVKDPGEKVKTIPSATWQQVKPDDEEDILLLL
jgi:hypothetical protein